MSSHQIYNKRGTDHQRHARMANPGGPHGHDPPTKRDLYERDLRARFSPTAIFPGDPNTASTSTQDPQDPTDSFADPTSSPSDSSQAPATTSSNTPDSTSDPLDTSTTPTTSATSSSDTPTSTSTPPAVTSTSTSTATPTSTSSSTSLTSAVPTVVLPTSSVSTFTNTNVAPHTSSIASSATPSATPSTSGGTSTSLVVGGIAAGLVGLAGLIFAILFILRRWRKRGEDEQEFNAEAFRRQSAILVDDEPGIHGGSTEVNAGFNPRPPTMIERHMANRNQFDNAPPMPSLQQYNNVGASGAGGAGMGASGYGNGYDYPSRQPSFSPGQFMPSTTSPSPSASHQSFGTYGQPPMSNDAIYDDQGPLSRRPSNATALYNENGQLSAQRDLSRQNSMGGSAHYVDLDRSSVTPFQAAQYAEISRKLNEAPPPLHAVSEADEEPISQASDREMYASQAGEAHAHLSIPAEGANASPESPFTDPQVPAEVYHQPLVRPVQGFDAQDAVVPPSPIYSLHSEKVSHQRGPSNAPTLPEIRVPDRTFSPTSYDFPQTPSARPTPSPFHTNFSIPSPPIREQHPQSLAATAAESATPPTPAPAPAQAPAPNVAEREVTVKPQSQRPSSTYTVYDEADAYGGF